MALTFSNQEIKKIVDLISKGKKWSYNVSSADGKITWDIVNNPSKSKIDVIANKKYIDDYKYDTAEKDDVYATVLNVLDYLTNIVNKYNKRNKAVKEDISAMSEEEYFQHKVTRSLKIDIESDEFQEAISQGMLRAYSKRLKETDVHYTCKECSQNIPKYKGKYPTKCPKCGDSIKAMKEHDTDEAIWGGPFKAGNVVKVKLEDPNKFYNATLVTYNPSTNEYGAKLADGDDVGKIIQGIKRDQIKFKRD